MQNDLITIQKQFQRRAIRNTVQNRIKDSTNIILFTYQKSRRYVGQIINTKRKRKNDENALQRN